jgi:hypothetical protein
MRKVDPWLRTLELGRRSRCGLSQFWTAVVEEIKSVAVDAQGKPVKWFATWPLLTSIVYLQGKMTF